MNWRTVSISCLFLLITMFYSLRLTVSFIHYALFNDDFTELYCINKDKPKMECNGKCYLNKAFQKSNKTSKTNPIFNESVHKEIQLYVISHEDYLPKSTENNLELKNSFEIIDFYNFELTEKLLRPPTYI